MPEASEDRKTGDEGEGEVCHGNGDRIEKSRLGAGTVRAVGSHHSACKTEREKDLRCSRRPNVSFRKEQRHVLLP